MSLIQKYFPDMSFTPYMEVAPLMRCRFFMDRHFPIRSRVFQPFEMIESAMQTGASRAETGEQKMKFDFKLPYYRPDEVEVKVIDGNILEVVAESFEKNGRGESKRRHMRRYTFPNGVLQDEVKTTMSKEGVLTVEVSVPESMRQDKVLAIELKP